MTDLERMARKAGLYPSAELRIFADLIRAAERERCAKMCEAQTEPNPQLYYEVRRTALNCADAIRASR